MEACKWADSIYKINQMLSMVVGTDFSRLTLKRAGFVYNQLWRSEYCLFCWNWKFIIKSTV